MTNYIFETSSGEEIPVIIETRRGLRNITLRPKTGARREIHISKPWLVTTAAALRFLEQKRRWVERIFVRAPEKSKISDGDIIEFLGQRVRILQNSDVKSNYYTKLDNDGAVTLVIGGAPEMLERRVRDFIKKEFLETIKKLIKTTPLEFWPKKITIRDTTSRWGSCSSTGTISFSWRLAFAPFDVMRYVVMHELAHRKHMDHSPQFWAQVAELYGEGVGRTKLWLSKNGGTLHQYF